MLSSMTSSIIGGVGGGGGGFGAALLSGLGGITSFLTIDSQTGSLFALASSSRTAVALKESLLL